MNCGGRRTAPGCAYWPTDQKLYGITILVVFQEARVVVHHTISLGIIVGCEWVS